MKQFEIVINISNGLRKSGENTVISQVTYNKIIELANSFINDNKKEDLKNEIK